MNDLITLNQETLDTLHENLTTIADSLNHQIDLHNSSTELKEETKQETVKTNVIDKAKSSLTSDEKSRFLAISKIFIKEWIDRVQQLKAQSEKQDQLSGANREEPKPKRNIFTLLGKKKEGLGPKQEKKSSWLSKLLLLVGGLGTIYAIFRDKIGELPGKLWDSLKDLGGAIYDFAGGLLSQSWDYVKSTMKDVWEWVTKNLGLDTIGAFILDIWQSTKQWCVGVWDKVVGVWNSIKNFLLELPGKIWDWICEAVMSLIQPILDALSEAWKWLCDVAGKAWNWIWDQLKGLWEGLKGAWQSVVGFFQGIWDWIAETFSWDNIWGSIKNYFSNAWKTLKDAIILLVQGKFKELIHKYLIDPVMGIFNKLRNSWIGRQLGLADEEPKPDVKKVEKKQTVTKIKPEVTTVVRAQQEIKVAKNILETVKAVTDRLNVFFSDKTGSFLDLSAQLIKSAQDGFKNLVGQIGKIQVKNEYDVENDLTYRDSYDQSDKSQKTINNDYRKQVTEDFSITYNNIDIPQLNEVMKTVRDKTQTELRLLQSQNDYLDKMIASIFGLNTKLEWLDPEKLKDLKGQNMIIPFGIKEAAQTLAGSSDTILATAQVRFADAFKR